MESGARLGPKVGEEIMGGGGRMEDGRGKGGGPGEGEARDGGGEGGGESGEREKGGQLLKKEGYGKSWWRRGTGEGCGWMRSEKEKRGEEIAR